MSKVLCFGELLLRLSPQLGRQWIHQSSIPVYVGGAELNAAFALAKWGIPVSYCTSIPDNYFSNEIIVELQEKGIDTAPILFSGDRIGIYYLPQGADLKNAGVIYDRAHSSFSNIQPGQLDWKSIFQDVSWFHFSAINPALGENIAILCKEALTYAVNKGIYISVDLNYRAKLWQYGKQPNMVMPELVKYCDLVMGNLWAAEKMLDISMEATIQSKESYLAQAERTSLSIIERFPKCQQVANTFRFDNPSGLNYYATLHRNNQFHVSQEHSATEIVDKVGSGDCFMAGLIYGNYHKLPSQEIIDFAAAAAFKKLFIKGDATTVTAEEIKHTYMNYV